jgi:hypothetical protein
VDRRAEDGCWQWTAARIGGSTGRYGQFTTQGSTYAHRFSWELQNGPIPRGMFVCHRCDNGLCVNPNHLFLGTNADNMRDAASKHRLSVPRPGRHKITTDQLPVIDFFLEHGVKQIDIADQFGVSRTWVSLYAKGKRRQYDRQVA